jgi:AhpC/TSA family
VCAVWQPQIARPGSAICLVTGPRDSENRPPDERPPGDRLGDLGAGRRPPAEPDLDPADERSAAERLAELDVTRPEDDAPQAAGPPARPSGVYNWVIGVLFFAVIALAAFSTLPDAGSGLRGPEEGEVLPDFAAANAAGGSDADANIKQSGSGGDGTAACEVRERAALNICDLRASKPVVITFAFTRGADCEPAFDVVEEVWKEFPGIAFVGVFSGEKREKVIQLVRNRGWNFPVAVDPDGAVTNLYGVGGCPTTTFAYKGGEVMDNELGELSADELRDRLRDLLRGRGESTPSSS